MKTTNTEQTRVRMGEDVYLYNVKAPYVASGHGEYGALRLDVEKDKVMCHECGEWFQSVAAHIKRHKINCSSYKQRHGLTVQTALVNERVRIALSNYAISKLERGYNPGLAPMLAQAKLANSRRKINGKVKGRRMAEKLNKHRRCHEQILDDIKKLAQSKGRTPTLSEIKNNCGLSEKVIRYHFGSVAYAMVRAGLSPRAKGGAYPPELRSNFLSKQRLISSLKAFYQIHDRIPRCSDARRGLLPNTNTFVRRFGSWNLALKASGLARVILMQREALGKRRASR